MFNFFNNYIYNMASFQWLLKDKRVLYVLVFLAVTNLIGYLMAHNIHAVVAFCLIGFAASYFSKNMIIILSASLLFTNFVVGSLKVKEHFDNKNDVNQHMKDKFNLKDDHKDLKKSDFNKKYHIVDKRRLHAMMKGNNKEGFEQRKEKEPSTSVDYASTLEKAYDSLDSLIGKDGISKMSEDTRRLAEKQKMLMQNIESMAPLLENAGKMLNALPLSGLGNLQNSISNAVGSLNGLKPKLTADEE